MSRRRQLDLTDQQERVLELLARGRTNFEIAQSLDMTLDGAKYHIRQVFDKLGVDSREEAVAAWKASRGGVFERVRGWLWPVGAMAVGGVAVVAAVVVGAVMLSGGGFGSTSNAAGGGSVPAGVWVAEIVPADARNPAGAGTLKVFRASDEAHTHVFDGSYIAGGPYGLQWSADGKHLAVTGQFSGGTTAVWKFTRDGSKWTAASTSGNAFLGSVFKWSPNSSMLTVVGPVGGDPKSAAVRASLVNPSGKVLASIDIPADPTGGLETRGSPTWSRDGSLAVWEINGKVVALSPGDARIVDGAGGPDEIARSLTGASTPDGTNPTSGPSVAALLSLPSSFPIVEQGTTADGTGIVFGPALVSPTGGDATIDYSVAVQSTTGEITKIELGERAVNPGSTLHEGYDIVITK